MSKTRITAHLNSKILNQSTDTMKTLPSYPVSPFSCSLSPSPHLFFLPFLPFLPIFPSSSSSLPPHISSPPLLPPFPLIFLPLLFFLPFLPSSSPPPTSFCLFYFLLFLSFSPHLLAFRGSQKVQGGRGGFSPCHRSCSQRA